MEWKRQLTRQPVRRLRLSPFAFTRGHHRNLYRRAFCFCEKTKHGWNPIIRSSRETKRGIKIFKTVCGARAGLIRVGVRCCARRWQEYSNETPDQYSRHNSTPKTVVCDTQ